MPHVTRFHTNDREDFASDLDEIAREGARRMLAQALEAEVADYIARSQERDEGGRANVVRKVLIKCQRVRVMGVHAISITKFCAPGEELSLDRKSRK